MTYTTSSLIGRARDAYEKTLHYDLVQELADALEEAHEIITSLHVADYPSTKHGRVEAWVKKHGR